MDPMCAVATCPSLRDGRFQFCRPHREAVLARTVAATDKRCAHCKRAIKADDYVRREMVKRTVIKSKPGAPYTWQHVACDPAPSRLSRKQRREAPKPLLLAEVTCDAEGDR
jgi:hypothetical protein